MKKMIWTLLLCCFCVFVEAQEIQVHLDSLFYSGFDWEQIKRTNGNKDSLLRMEPMSTKRLDYGQFYISGRDTTQRPSILHFYTPKGNHGWYAIKHNPMCDMYGARPAHPISYMRAYWYSSHMSITTIGCLNHGIPQFQWAYFIGWSNVTNSPIMVKRENYDNGKLHGEYLITTGKETVYRTVFEQGTGEYLDVYPDGAIRSQGYIKDSRLHGIWYFYARVREAGYRFRIVAEYDMGRELYWRYEAYRKGEWMPKKRLPKGLRRSQDEKDAEEDIR